MAEPRVQVKGQVARIYFYMHQRCDLPMSEGQKRLFSVWDKLFPVTEWELERDRRIKAIIGHSNPFVSPRTSSQDRPTNSANKCHNSDFASQPTHAIIPDSFLFYFGESLR